MAEQAFPDRSSVSSARWCASCSDRNVANCRNTGQLNYARLFSSSVLGLGIGLPFATVHAGVIMLRIRRSANGQVVFTISGRIQTDDIEQFRQLLVVETPGQPLIFNMRDLTLVNRDAVAFLAECEAKGIKLENCPLHIRNWIDQEKRRGKRQQRQKRDT